MILRRMRHINGKLSRTMRWCIFGLHSSQAARALPYTRDLLLIESKVADQLSYTLSVSKCELELALTFFCLTYVIPVTNFFHRTSRDDIMQIISSIRLDCPKLVRVNYVFLPNFSVEIFFYAELHLFIIDIRKLA